MPHASEYHDDGIYYVSAKSLAGSGKFAIESLPATPAQTKYPPFWPAILSIAWAIEPRYPDNLPVAMLLCWLWIPLSLVAYLGWLRQAGLPPRVRLLIGVLWAVNPYILLFGTGMLSELPFTGLLLFTFLCLPRERPHWAVVAGLLAGCTFLTRTAGIGLLPAGLIYFGLRGRWKKAGLFAAGMLPAILGWGIWSVLNRATGTDAVTLYYTNYFGYYLSIFQWSEAHLYAWKNLDGMIHGLGALLLPDTSHSLLDKVLAETLAIAGLIGVVRLVKANRESVYVPYAVFAVVNVVMLILWHFPPNERLMLPLAPLWLVGVYSEMKRLVENIGKVFKKPEMSQKVAGGVIVGLLAAFFMLCAARQWELLTDGLPRFYRDHASRLERSEPAMAWIRGNLPPGALFLSENDPLLYLRTGRRGSGLEMILTTIHWYREDHAARTADHAAAPAYARRYGLEYFLLNEWDYARDMPAEEQVKLLRALRSDARLEKLFESGPTAVYRIR
ncbi:MAG: hypothetical protein HYX27_18830 [Acidobacteria bacterium]|nr:hypothetical protein [Acidobacteriota bacterium]